MLNDNKKPEDAEAEMDFLWLKCHKVSSAKKSHHVPSSKTLTYTLLQGVTVQTIRQQYMARNFQTEEVLLKFDNRFLDDPTPMRELNDHGDNVIAMEAVKRSDLPARAPRQPLQPSNAQIPAKPASPASETVKSESHYASPYAPRTGTPASLNTPGSMLSNSSRGLRMDQSGYNMLANRLPSKSPLLERSQNPQRDDEARQEVLRHLPNGVHGWNEAMDAAVAKARTIMAKNPVQNVENLPAPLKPNLTALAQHDSALREQFKQQFPWKSDGMIPIADETSLD